MERRRRVRRTARLAAVFTAAALFACPAVNRAEQGRGEERAQETGPAAEAEQAQGAELTGADAGGPEQAAEAAVEPELYALAAVLTDGDTGRILWGKNERERRPMASTTKIMTCILALEEGDPEDIAVFSPLAASQPQVHLGAPAGRSFYLKDLLYSLMLESHNDTAVAVAECVSGSVEEFVAEMNRKAGELGCEDTWFVTPNGLDGTSPDGSGRERAHSTTAADLARIMRYCLRESPAREEFRAITGTSSYTFKDTEGIGTYSCANHNALLTMMEGAVSGKTGFTGEAGYSYVGALERDGKCLIVALLGSGWPPNKTYKWSDTRALMEYGLENYEYQEVWRDVDIQPAAVENGIPESGNLGETAFVELEAEPGSSGRSVRLLLREGEEVEVRYEGTEKLPAPVREGEEAGRVIYSLNGETVASFPVTAQGSVGEITLRWCLEDVLEKYFLRSFT